ncbi:MAG: SdrD B-like domain-containing protein, partial [Anaerolineales bacterium]
SGVHHFFPSIAVNANNDMAVGFSRSSSSLFVEGVYTGRESTDPVGTIGTIQVCKLGEDSYVKDFGGGDVRWGDYSATVVDPSDDTTFWTLQEYAETEVGPNPNDDRWGTWWCSAGWNTMGDYVWYDTNQDGIQDGGESGIPGVTVNLFTGSDVLADTTTTDSAGLYNFTNLTPDYYVEFVPPPGYSFTQKDQGADDTIDSDADPVTGQTITTTLTAGENDSTWDAGMYKPNPVYIDKQLDQSDAEFSVGDYFTYTILIRNDSPFMITAMSLIDTYDTSAVEFVDALPVPDSVNTGVGSLNWNDLTISLGDLSPGESLEIIIGFQAANPTDVVNNTVDVQDITSTRGSFPDISDTNSEAQIIEYIINLPLVLNHLIGLW